MKSRETRKLSPTIRGNIEKIDKESFPAQNPVRLSTGTDTIRYRAPKFSQISEPQSLEFIFTPFYFRDFLSKDFMPESGAKHL